MTYTVGDLARLAGITVRTLHHYDELGLVVPHRSQNGYRVYGFEEVERLQEVLFYRELGFGLDDIRRLIDEPDYDRAAALHSHKELLERNAERALALLEAVDRATNAVEKGIKMTADEMLGVFGDFDPSEYVDEAQQRWGDTDAYRESMRRTSSYTGEDWERIRAEATEINDAFWELLSRAVRPESPEAMDVAERHRTHITNSFYECPVEIHESLGRMYVSDPRFTENIDKVGEGLAAFMSQAIIANAARHRLA